MSELWNAKADQLLTWILENREKWQLLQEYIDNQIADITTHTVSAIKKIDRDELLRLNGQIEAYEHIRDIGEILRNNRP